MSDAIDLTRAVAVDPAVRRFRRLVTGDDAQGNAYFLEDRTCPNVQSILGIATFATTELWKTFATPEALPRGPVTDPSDGPVALAPPPGGAVFRIVEFPPDHIVKAGLPERPPESLMHRTPSIDFAYVIEGEIYAVLDKDEALMRGGDVLIQRGTNHSWSNRTDRPCRILFVLISARPGDDS